MKREPKAFDSWGRRTRLGQRHKKIGDKKCPITCAITETQKEHLDLMASRVGEPRSELVRMAIMQFLNNNT